MTDRNKMDDTDLEALFEVARSAPPDVPDTLMARVLEDAVQMQPAASLWARIMDAVGGLPGVGGLVTATCVGVWLGVAPPAAVPDLAGAVMGFETLSDDLTEGGSLTGFGWDIEEG